MATKSIYKNIKVENARDIVSALEEAHKQKPVRVTLQRKVTDVRGVDIQKLFLKCIKLL